MVVSDTSVLLNLCVVGREDLLTALYGEVLAPDAVAIEFDSLVIRDSRFRGQLAAPRARPQNSSGQRPGYAHPHIEKPGKGAS